MSTDEVAGVRSPLRWELDTAQARIAELETQLEESRAMRGADASLELLGANLETHGWELKGNLRAPNFQRWFSTQVSRLLEHHGAENNLSWDWSHGHYGTEEWRIEITRGGCPSPSAQRDALKAELASAQERISELESAA